jgi:hypothetical protein
VQFAHLCADIFDMSDRRATLRVCLRHLLGPIVRFCLKNSLSLQEFHQLSKELFVETAAREIERTGAKVNVSRLSVATGVQRREVNRILEAEGGDKEPPYLLARVLTLWERESRYHNSRGKPRPLTHGFDTSEFSDLVREVSKNVNPASVLFEMTRLGIANKTDSSVRLNREDATMRRDEAKAYELVANDMQALIQAVGENVSNLDATPHLHFHTEYDNIFVQDVASIRKWLVDEGRKFHRKVRLRLAKSDRDVSSSRGTEGAPAGARIVCTSFAYTALPEPAEKEGAKSKK